MEHKGMNEVMEGRYPEPAPPYDPVMQEPRLPWESRTVIRILLEVAAMLCLDKEWRDQVGRLANHINMGPPRN